MTVNNNNLHIFFPKYDNTFNIISHIKDTNGSHAKIPDKYYQAVLPRKCLDVF